MANLPTIIPITALRQDAATVLKQVSKSDDPFVITQRGRAAAVLLSAEAYQRAESERQILRLLAQGKKKLLKGEVSTWTRCSPRPTHCLRLETCDR